jgi:uncharacterized membrane protein
MSILQKLRLIAAIVLICAIFLPLSQCSRQGQGQDHDVNSPQALAHSRHLFPRSDDEYVYWYGISYVSTAYASPKDNGLSGAVTLIAFLWPLGFAIWSRKSQFPRFWWVFYLVESLLCAGTIYWVYALTLGGRKLYGFYVAEGAIAIYAITTVIIIVTRLRNFFHNRRADPKPSPA